MRYGGGGQQAVNHGNRSNGRYPAPKCPPPQYPRSEFGPRNVGLLSCNHVSSASAWSTSWRWRASSMPLRISPMVSELMKSCDSPTPAYQLETLGSGSPSFPDFRDDICIQQEHQSSMSRGKFSRPGKVDPLQRSSGQQLFEIESFVVSSADSPWSSSYCLADQCASTPASMS